MKPESFRAMVVSESDGAYERAIVQRTTVDLPAGELLVRVHYSSLNYKDALSASGARGVTRSYPHTPGIDAAGVVAAVEGGASNANEFAPGDEVIAIGYDLGVNTAGGYGQYIRIPSGWSVKRPPSLSLRESMILGTAGFTAAMSVDRLVAHGVQPGDGEVLVTGATGGVGSVAVALLAHLGFEVVAVTGKDDQHDYLRRLGAVEFLTRAEATDVGKRPLLKGRWSGVVDSVGGEILATALKSARYGGAVTSCGLAASPLLPTTVFPFILRGVTLYGIDSVQCDIAYRKQLWDKLAAEWKPDNLGDLVKERTLDELSPEIDRILQGQQVGRVLVNMLS